MTIPGTKRVTAIILQTVSDESVLWWNIALEVLYCLVQSYFHWDRAKAFMRQNEVNDLI